jgi:hypothetical protein
MFAKQPSQYDKHDGQGNPEKQIIAHGIGKDVDRRALGARRIKPRAHADQ